MTFYSTNKKAPDVDFTTALFEGLAPDGGLYMPHTIPEFTHKELNEILSLHDAAFAVLRKWLPVKEMPDEALQSIVAKAFTYPIPLVTVGDYSVLELFHGPTMAFKDIAARVLAQLFAYYLEKEKRRITILVATSGDTGGAMVQAFSGIPRVKVVVLYPKGKVSVLQEEQITRAEKNVTALGVTGDFDDCQTLVKQAFQDPDLEQLHLSSANSINIGRLIPQIIYYMYTSRILGLVPLRFVVPSGNMGNVTAALFANRMGMPLDSLLIATNENDVAVNYYQTGIYQARASIRTLSTAMDIGKPSNFERILELFGHDHKAFCKQITAIKVSDTETVSTIRNVFIKEQYVLDFHTAVGYCAAEKIHTSEVRTVVVSTASPKKFADEMKKETGITVANAQLLKNLRRKKKRVLHVSNQYNTIKQVLLGL